MENLNTIEDFAEIGHLDGMPVIAITEGRVLKSEIKKENVYALKNGNRRSNLKLYHDGYICAEIDPSGMIVRRCWDAYKLKVGKEKEKGKKREEPKVVLIEDTSIAWTPTDVDEILKSVYSWSVEERML